LTILFSGFLSKDCISVWKRTEWVPGKDAAAEGSEESGQDSEEGEDMWASIPPEETLPTTKAATKFKFLLEK
jgi:hypothetical protein